MFDSMNMHSPAMIAFVSILLLVVVAGLFVVVRIAGARLQREDAPASARRDGDGPSSPTR